MKSPNRCVGLIFKGSELSGELVACRNEKETVFNLLNVKHAHHKLKKSLHKASQFYSKLLLAYFHKDHFYRRRKFCGLNIEFHIAISIHHA